MEKYIYSNGNHPECFKMPAVKFTLEAKNFVPGLSISGLFVM